MVDPDRLSAAYETARCDLIAESAPRGHWIGRLCGSPFATAAAISALAIVERHAPTVGGRFADEAREGRLSELIMASVHWLADRQNPDGGWGDSDKSLSNLAATILVRSAFALTAVPADHPGMLERADAYIKTHGGVRGLHRRYRRDKNFAVPILTSAALAGLIPWRKVPAMPFERACLAQHVFKQPQGAVASYAMPALMAIGQARYFHRRSWNPLAHLVRRRAVDASLRVLVSMQPASGGFFEAAPLTSFVVMSLASSDRADHPVVRNGVEFLLATVRSDGSWPIETNLATWNTTLAINALASSGEEIRELACLDWLLACQHHKSHPFTGAQPGGWAWTDAAGGVPETDDTSGALLALAAWIKRGLSPADAGRMEAAASDGVKWLLDMQNSDGGWPAFGRGRGRSLFDRSASDLTAHALRALHAWRTTLVKISDHARELRTRLDARIGAAIERGFGYLAASQHAEGYWVPLWFGNQHRAGEDNPVYGTARVLAAYRDLARLDEPAAARALEWLITMKHGDGSWGGALGAPSPLAARQASVEETALAVEALVSCGRAPAHEAAAQQGLEWLIAAVESNRHQESSPVGKCFGRLWYHEKLYPLVWTVAALGRRAQRPAIPPVPAAAAEAWKR